jgi:hypothetical protein
MAGLALILIQPDCDSIKCKRATRVRCRPFGTQCAVNGYALWAEATEAIQKYGVMIKSPSGYPVQSPYVAVANRQAEIMMRIASEFGFTPASRSRISTHPKAEPTLFDRLEDYPDEVAS